jgi:hypothetical protein
LPVKSRRGIFEIEFNFNFIYQIKIIRSGTNFMAAKKSVAAQPVAKGTKGGKTSKAAAGQPTTKEKSLGELTSALAGSTGTTKAQAKAFLDAHAELLIGELKTSGGVQLAGIDNLKMGERTRCLSLVLAINLFDNSRLHQKRFDLLA